METGFVLLQPAMLAVAAGVLLLLPALLPRRADERHLLPALTLIALLALSAAMVLADTSPAHVLLTLIAVGAAVYLAYAIYRREALPLTPRQRWNCGALRAIGLIALLMIIARPAWTSAYEQWHKPLLVALMDHSDSIGLTDPDNGGISRAETANRAFRAAAAPLGQLQTLYEVRRLTLAETPRELNSWQFGPRDDRTAIAAALREAAMLRSSLGEPPVGVLICSDGAENVVDPAVVVQAGQALAQREVPILAVGIGPGPERTPGVLIEPLDVPSEIGARDEVAVNLVAHVFGCDRREVIVDLFWHGLEGQPRRVAINGDRATFREGFKLLPPRAGLLRLTARVTLPDALGGESFEKSTVVRVVDQAIRVLYLARQPTSELAFVGRALRADPRFELTVKLRRDAARVLEPIDWTSYDVVVLGRAPLTRGETTQLAEAVQRRGTGLLLAGGQTLLNSPEYARGDLKQVSPAAFVLRAERSGEVRMQATARGLRHSALYGLVSAVNQFDQLPPLAGGAEFGRSSPLAEVLFESDGGDPLLIAHEVGRGRCAAAAWEATWPWALVSDDGLQLHRSLWQQLVVWLSNRRPTAWVLADKVRYGEQSLASGAEQIELRAGVSGAESGPLAEARWIPELRLRVTEDAQSQPASAPAAIEIPLQASDEGWTAVLPESVPGLALPSGEYLLEFRARATLEDGEQIELPGGSGFFVERIEPELQAPTANLGLLARTAEQTGEVGGRYVPLTQFEGLLTDLTSEDPRQAVPRRTQLVATQAFPWWLWLVVVLTLGAEWTMRKRLGLP